MNIAIMYLAGILNKRSFGETVSIPTVLGYSDCRRDHEERSNGFVGFIRFKAYPLKFASSLARYGSAAARHYRRCVSASAYSARRPLPIQLTRLPGSAC